MGVRLLGVLRLGTGEVDGHALTGLSALAWDEDEDTLYALSDRGVLFHMRIAFDAQGLLSDARAVHAHALRDARGKPLTGGAADSEGMVARHTGNGVRGDTELAVSFERRPRVLRFDTRGTLLGSVALPPALRDRRHYRSANRGLESLAWHPRYGYLTAPEQPFRDESDGIVELHAIETGRLWRYALAPEPNAALTELDVLEDGSLLALERGYGVFFVPVIMTLRRVRDFPADGAALSVETVARFNTGQGWALDNFEGLTHLGAGRLLMVSDDNARAFQSTLLAAFELLDTVRSADEPSIHEPGRGTGPAIDVN